MGFRLSCVVAMSAVILLLSARPAPAQAASETDCGPQFKQLTAANVIPSYRQVTANQEAMKAFHHSIPTGPNATLEAHKKHIHECYRRIEGLLAPRAEAGEVEAQFVLGHLLLHAYNPIFGGHFPVDQEGEHGRKRGHDWLVKADKADHFDAADLLIRYYSTQVDFSIKSPLGGALSDDPPQPWLPKPKEMLDWLEQAGPRGHVLGYIVLAHHYNLRAMYADLGKAPSEAQRYREISEQYRQIADQGLNAAESPGSGD